MKYMKKAASIVLAEIPLFLLFLPKNRTGILTAAVLFFLVGIFLYRRPEKVTNQIPFLFTAVILSAGILSGFSFYLRWQNTTRMKNFADFLNCPPKQICAITASILCLCFCLALFFILRFFPIRCSGPENNMPLDLFFIFLLSAVSINLLTKCSPFFPFNDWVDPNTMFTLGKGMLHGTVPYRDLYEQKGPLLLALHTLAAAISYKSLLGVWIVEIAACFFTLWFLYKILQPWFGRKALAAVPVLALLMYASKAFVAGDSAEEMSLPLLTYGIYIGIKAVRENRLPTYREGFWIGVTSGCILWIKFSHLGFYAGWFLYFFIQAIFRKETRELFQVFLRIILGVFTAAVPVFLYFGINHAIPVFLECYFINNVRYYPAFSAATGTFRHLVNLRRGFMRFTEANPALIVFTFAGLFWCFLRGWKRLGSFLLLTLLSGFVVMFVSGVSFPYYVFIFGSFSVFGVMWLLEIPAFSRSDISVSAVVSFFICTTGCLILSTNMYILAFSKEDFPQFKVKEAIESSGIKDPDILHYGLLDAGFNLPTGLIPKQRFFCSFNLRLPEMIEAQDLYVEEGVTDFVITCHEPLYDAEHYQLIGTYPGDFAPEGGVSLFFLYQRIEN